MSGILEERQRRILEMMIQDDEVEVLELADRLQVSAATVRRDLRALKERGLLQRTHGGATPITSGFYAALHLDSSFSEQVRRQANEKRRIGLAAAALVSDGDTIAMTPGTTTSQVARSIVGTTGVTMIVSSVNLAMELSNRSDLRIFVPGGFMRPNWFSLTGATTVRDVQQFNTDIVFIGVNGIHADRGLSSKVVEEAAVNRAMIEQARTRVVVADHTKLGQIHPAIICPTTMATTLVTDRGASDEDIAPYSAMGIEVIRA